MVVLVSNMGKMTNTHKFERGQVFRSPFGILIVIMVNVEQYRFDDSGGPMRQVVKVVDIFVASTCHIARTRHYEDPIQETLGNALVCITGVDE